MGSNSASSWKKSWGKHLSYKMEKKMTFEAYFMREIAIYSESLTMIEKERKTDNKKEHDFATLLLESHCSELQKYKQGKIGLQFVDMWC